MRTKYITLLIITIFVFNIIYSQSLSRNKYVIITYVDDYSKGFHGKQNYSWVIPVDSIKSFENILYPFYVSYFAKSQFADCSLGKSVDPAIPSLKPGDYNFDSVWSSSHDKLNKLYKERKLIQTIKKVTHDGDSKETIKIYATPIIGELCSCTFLYTITPPALTEEKYF